MRTSRRKSEWEGGKWRRNSPGVRLAGGELGREEEMVPGPPGLYKGQEGVKPKSDLIVCTEHQAGPWKGNWARTRERRPPSVQGGADESTVRGTQLGAGTLGSNFKAV